MEILGSILSGAIGGFAATSMGSIAVQKYKQPVIEFNDGVVKKGSSPYDGRNETAEYDVQIQNTGRSVATNCKPRIILEGTHDTTVNEPFMAEDGWEVDEVDVTKEYTINVVPEWTEESSNRIDINQDEYASFRLFKASKESVGPEVHEKIRFGTVLPEDKMAEKDGIFSEPIRVETPPPRMDTEPNVTYKSSIGQEIFNEIDWEIKKIIVTSANSKKLEAELNLEWEASSLPELSLE
ncbi:hypothetical protein GJ631_14985 [Natronomonas sp. CBA1123]|uniref:hypothetical protein n=1 Tax=Natronomonas sp. CBA1123 TaxID=2668070 RepID=UPI0012E995D6|nr:hypothetical protein [Natronomonas sp. CBA1123]MUV87820.1 hypothetical protein [Natronomonas sp. CBA1123]